MQEVRVGCSETGVSSLELEEGGSPPARPSPPGTPAPPHHAHAHPHPHPHAPDLSAPLLQRTEPLELQLDYWLVSKKHAHTHIPNHTNLHTQMHIHTCIYIHTYTHSETHTHTHTHIYILKLNGRQICTLGFFYYYTSDVLGDVFSILLFDEIIYLQCYDTTV